MSYAKFSSADDLKLYTLYKLDASHNDLQIAVDRLTNWARFWQFQIAVSKCSAFRISNPQWKIAGDIVNKSYSIDGSILPFADCIRDLGIYHDCRLKYDQHISILSLTMLTNVQIFFWKVFILVIHRS